MPKGGKRKVLTPKSPWGPHGVSFGRLFSVGRRRAFLSRSRNPKRANCPEGFLTLPLSQTHSFALTGADASVSPKGRERERRPLAPARSNNRHRSELTMTNTTDPWRRRWFGFSTGPSQL